MRIKVLFANRCQPIKSRIQLFEFLHVKQVIRCHISLSIKAIYQGPKKKKRGGWGGGGRAWGVSDRSIGALKILPRSPEPHLFGAWSPNVILLRSLEPSKSLLQSPESQILAFKHASTPEYSGSLLVDHALVINMKVVKSQ